MKKFAVILASTLGVALATAGLSPSTSKATSPELLKGCWGALDKVYVSAKTKAQPTTWTGYPYVDYVKSCWEQPDTEVQTNCVFCVQVRTGKRRIGGFSVEPLDPGLAQQYSLACNAAPVAQRMNGYMATLAYDEELLIDFAWRANSPCPPSLFASSALRDGLVTSVITAPGP